METSREVRDKLGVVVTVFASTFLVRTEWAGCTALELYFKALMAFALSLGYYSYHRHVCVYMCSESRCNQVPHAYAHCNTLVTKDYCSINGHITTLASPHDLQWPSALVKITKP